MPARKPFTKSCAIMVPSHRSPTLTRAPRQPTSAKNDERNALRRGPASAAIITVNSRASKKKKRQAQEPRREQRRLRPNHAARPGETAESLQVKLEKSRQAVSIATSRE